ncbi:MAG: hypothetical protein WD065_19470 [Planctomycetaceae bacterium]
MTQLLEKELATFNDHKSELLSSSRGKFVLIHEGDVVGTYNDSSDAIQEGYARFGNVPFLVKQITEVKIPANFANRNIRI